uniref:Uncharacterized protein n=2 Tax=unclassified bacterial viruses TaxID=12333 RepID=A0AAU6VZ01_9VIRU
MIVSELIDWLQTLPQDAKVKTLEHYNNGGYYEQGGNTYIADFTDKEEVRQWRDDGQPPEYIYGDHFELSHHNGEYTLQIGVTGK